MPSQTNNVQINVIVNILLLAAKGVAAIWSSSLSLIASLVDSALDLLCTVIIWTTNKLVSWRVEGLRKKFPIGRRRLEPIGILVFSILMVISFLQILQESVKKLLPSGDHSVSQLPPAAIFAMVATIVVKGTIWVGCARVKTTQVQALAQDCKTGRFIPFASSNAMTDKSRRHLQHALPSVPAHRRPRRRLVARSSRRSLPFAFHHLRLGLHLLRERYPFDR